MWNVRSSSCADAAMGRLARAEGIDRLFAVGSLSRNAAKSFGSDAMSFENATELTTALENALAPDVNVLIKASRFMALDKVVAALVADATVREGAG